MPVWRAKDHLPFMGFPEYSLIELTLFAGPLGFLVGAIVVSTKRNEFQGSIAVVNRGGKAMFKSFMTACAAFSIFMVAAQTGFADNPCGARWYPFYGYRQPAYLVERPVATVQPAVVTAPPAAVTAQPNGAQTHSAGYWPSETTVAPPVVSYYSRASTSGKWYPFYGYRRPAYLGQ
jgi:hypothetical protein